MVALVLQHCQHRIGQTPIVIKAADKNLTDDDLVRWSTLD